MEKKRAPKQAVEFSVSGKDAQPLMVLEYLNSWGNEFLFIFLIITCAFLLLFVNLVESSLPDTVQTILGFEVPSYWATQVPIFVLIIAALALAVYYNMRRKYIEGMMYFFFQQTARSMEPQKKAKR